LEFEYFISSDRFETDVDFDDSNQLSAIGHQPEDEESIPVIAAPDGEIINVNTEEQVTTETDAENFDVERSEVPASIESVNEYEVPGSIESVNENETTIASEQKMAEAIERVLEREEEQLKEPAQNADLVFEPYHTVDYFASQGIKLSQEEIPKDKFGKQLKSFTEWLKTLKRLPATEVTKEIDTSAESQVQHLAEDSVHRSDVVTEAMAEVWIKQGNKEKAIETYNKLGLLNPSKKAYFAGLIENLKRS